MRSRRERCALRLFLWELKKILTFYISILAFQNKAQGLTIWPVLAAANNTIRYLMSRGPMYRIRVKLWLRPSLRSNFHAQWLTALEKALMWRRSSRRGHLMSLQQRQKDDLDSSAQLHRCILVEAVGHIAWRDLSFCGLSVDQTAKYGMQNRWSWPPDSKSRS